MKGKIDKNGFLYIKRGNGVYKKQMCPDSKGNLGYIGCGDWCPLFEEPKYGVTVVEKHKTTKNATTLNLCKVSIDFDQFIDERKDPNNYEIDMQADLTQEICKRYWALQEQIEIIENIAEQINTDEHESRYSKKDDQFAANIHYAMCRTKECLLHLKADVIEFDDNGDE